MLACLLLALTLAASSARADTSSTIPAPSPKIRWVLASGRLFDSPIPPKSAWAWREADATHPTPYPVLRTALVVPPLLQVLPPTHPRVELRAQSQGGQALIIEQEGRLASFSLEVLNEGRKHDRINLLSQVEGGPTATLAHPSCEPMDLFLESSESTAHPLYFALHCDPDGLDAEGRQRVTLLKPEGSTWSSLTTLPPFEKEGPNWRSYLLALPKPSVGLPSTEPVALGRLTLFDSQGRGLPITLLRRPPDPSKAARFGASFDLSPTYLSYSEPSIGVRITQLGLTGKANASYKLIPGKLDVGMNTFFTLVSSTSSSDPIGLPPSRFYGINGRVGYELPVKNLPLNGKLFLMTGWYWTGMLVPLASDGIPAYGVVSLMGPQIYLFATGLVGKRARLVRMYLKYASIQKEAAIFSLTNRELAMGGGLQVGQIRLAGKQRPVSISADLAASQFADELGSLKIFVTSFGISIGL